MDNKSLSAVVYNLHCDWSLLLLVNTHGNFHYKQGILLVNMETCKQGSLYETSFYNFLWYMEQNLQLPVSIWKIIPTCYHRNKGEVEYILLYMLTRGHAPRICLVLQDCF